VLGRDYAAFVEHPTGELPRISLSQLSEKGTTNLPSVDLARIYGTKSAGKRRFVVRKATLQAPPKLFGQVLHALGCIKPRGCAGALKGRSRLTDHANINFSVTTVAGEGWASWRSAWATPRAAPIPREVCHSEWQTSEVLGEASPTVQGPSSRKILRPGAAGRQSVWASEIETPSVLPSGPSR
jgi:hypothetical protein